MEADEAAWVVQVVKGLDHFAFQCLNNRKRKKTLRQHRGYQYEYVSDDYCDEPACIGSNACQTSPGSNFDGTPMGREREGHTLANGTYHKQ